MSRKKHNLRIRSARNRRLTKKEINTIISLLIIIIKLIITYPKAALTIISIIAIYVLYPSIKLELFEITKTNNGIAIIVFLCLIFFIVIVLIINIDIKRNRLVIEQEIKFKNKISEILISDKSDDYIITNYDFNRGIKKELLYRKKFILILLSMFENCCAKCKRNDNGLDIDHFFISKKNGGCFIMKHKDGYLINNAIPLCQSCNRSKSDKNYKKFYSRDEILYLFEKNKSITEIINNRIMIDKHGNIKAINI